MKGKQRIYNIYQQAAAIFMIMALLWLTVSTPFVFASQQHFAKQTNIGNSQSPVSGSEEDTDSPFSTTTEEKNPTSTSFSEEYLHDHHITTHFFSISTQYHSCINAGTYVAYHGELLVPPPNAS